MFDYTNASDEIVANRNALADKVRRELELAGIATFRQENAGERAGAEIEVDLGADSAGGVFVSWNPHPSLSQAAADGVRNGQLQVPAIRHSGAVVSHMRDAMIGILASAGFRADIADDDMRPLAIRVWEDEA
ncbi:hypothetical protein [Streptomyces noursei]|uniref:hypothetical protein n=1 Tax=Streptomyces noursei TaxID=1971 RepID=UPI00167427CF|nr:hypothetical protein [Streptomyces noursei]MCZ1019778.1 hypothetical protein [Streptomyces noursei]GGX36694.1 hypothetical protein GCM10010341_67930 [Streptomyces noursei]